MTKSFLILIALSAFAAACHERREQPQPDYDAVKAASERSHASQDAEGAKLP